MKSVSLSAFVCHVNLCTVLMELLFVFVFTCVRHSAGHEHVVVPGYGPYAALSAAFPAGCHPEKENRTDLGKHPACSGSAHLAAVP